MSTWKDIRRLARRKHDEAVQGTEGIVPAETILKYAETSTNVKVLKRPSGDALLDGAEAAYDRDRRRIYYSSETSDEVYFLKNSVQNSF